MRTTVSFVLLVLVPLTVQGATVSETLDPALFGNLWRDLAEPPHQSSRRGSAPVSFTNSLVYLQNAFPEVYGEKGLVDYAGAVPTQSELGIVADILAGPDYMDWDESWENYCFCGEGPYWDTHSEIIARARAAQITYIEERVPGTTANWEAWDWTSEPDVRAFIAEHIQRGDSVSLLIWQAALSEVRRTFLPITGIEYDSADDGGSINYIDLRNGMPTTISISAEFGLVGYQPNFLNPYAIGGILAISPAVVPEPATWALACVALLGVACMARRVGTAHKPS